MAWVSHGYGCREWQLSLLRFCSQPSWELFFAACWLQPIHNRLETPLTCPLFGPVWSPLAGSVVFAVQLAIGASRCRHRSPVCRRIYSTLRKNTSCYERGMLIFYSYSIRIQSAEKEVITKCTCGYPRITRVQYCLLTCSASKSFSFALIFLTVGPIQISVDDSVSVVVGFSLIYFVSSCNATAIEANWSSLSKANNVGLLHFFNLFELRFICSTLGAFACLALFFLFLFCCNQGCHIGLHFSGTIDQQYSVRHSVHLPWPHWPIYANSLLPPIKICSKLKPWALLMLANFRQWMVVSYRNLRDSYINI